MIVSSISNSALVLPGSSAVVGTIGHLTDSQLSVTLPRRPHEINSIDTFNQYALALEDLITCPLYRDFGLLAELQLALESDPSHIPPNNVSLPSRINPTTLHVQN